MTNIPIIDRFNLASDPKMPFLANTLNPIEVENQFNNHLAHLHQGKGKIELASIRTLRHKIGRRCLIEYKVKIISPQEDIPSITLLGKVRGKGLDYSSYKLNKTLWEKGFNHNSEDKISVPEPIGIIPDFQMWLQRKVDGVNSTDLLTKENGIDLAKKIALVAHKLHHANIPTKRSHTMADELSILHQRLEKMMIIYPHWQTRLERLLKLCDRLGENTPIPETKGIHRDFYPDQILVDGKKLYLLDLDLYCQGDVGVDIGNFMAHLTEQSLRTLGNPDALIDREIAVKNKFMELAGENHENAIESYKILTLVRHISISTQFPERQPFTSTLIDLCEQYFHRLHYL